jgi:hypothetical protein
MVLLNQPTHFKHSIFTPVCVFKAAAEEDPVCNDEEECIPAPVERQYLPGERLLKKVNKDRKKQKQKKKTLLQSRPAGSTISPECIDRISASLSRSVKRLTV